MSLRLTIIGAGPGGYVAALRAARTGARVTLVEEGEVGGTCLNKGCIPTKTLVASAAMVHAVNSAGEFGVEINGTVSYNLQKIRDRKNKVVATQVKGIRALLKSWGVDLLEGRGLLAKRNVVRITAKDGTTSDVQSDRVILATGSRPALLAGFSFNGRSILTSDDAVRFDHIPRTMLIVGAGVIGSEFAFIYRSFGVEVTVVDFMPRVLSTEDHDMSAVIEREMKKTRIKFMPGVTVDCILTADESGVTVRLSNGEEPRFDQLLVSVGRSLNSEQLGLESAGISTGRRGEIIVNEKMETNVPGIFAIGDVTGKLMLAHVASHQGLVAVENALGGHATMDYTVVPAGIFTMPEIGSVGLREHQAVEQGIQYRTGKFQYRALGKSHAMGEITGMVKVISDARTDKVLGVHICGAHATDLVHQGALAVKLGGTANDLGTMIHAHPTLSEAIMEAAEDVHDRAIHVSKSSK